MSQYGKFFKIKSSLTGMVLTVKGDRAGNGREVMPFPDKSKDGQIWYEDRIGNVIRSKIDDDFCLDMNDDKLVINTFERENPNQKWSVREHKIVNEMLDGMVLDIADGSEEEGSSILAGEYMEGDSQHWDFEFLKPQYCYIVNDHKGEVLDVQGEKSAPGTKIVVFEKDEEEMKDNQLWWEDKYGNIRSKLNDYVMDDAQDDIETQPYDADVESRQWVKYGRKIVNKNDTAKCLEVAKKSGLFGRKGKTLEAGEYEGREQQLWNFEYL